MLLQMELKSSLALEGLVALVAVHLSLGMSRKMANVAGLDGRLEVALLTPSDPMKHFSM